MILLPKQIKYVTISIVSPCICHEVMGPHAIFLSFLNIEYFFFFIYFFTEGELLYRILLFSVKPQHESAIGVHMLLLLLLSRISGIRLCATP